MFISIEFDRTRGGAAPVSVTVILTQFEMEPDCALLTQILEGALAGAKSKGLFPIVRVDDDARNIEGKPEGGA